MSRLRAALLLPVLLLAGCGAMHGPQAPVSGRTPAPAPATAEKTTVRDGAEPRETLAYYARARRMTAPELAREQEAARRLLARSRSDVNRVRYALLATLPGSPAGEEARALELLEPVVRNGDSALCELALMVTGFLQEQRRLDSHAQALQQKLDALLTLERNMTGREGGGTRKR